MSELGERIRELGARNGGIPTLSGLCGIPQSTLYEYRSGKSEPSASAILKLVEVTGVSFDWLISGKEKEKNTPSRASEIPIRGTAAGSITGSIAITENVIEWVKRPIGLERVPDAYGLYVTGSSMSPRYKEGEIIFVHPHKPVALGNIMIIQQQNHQSGDRVAYIKEFISKSDKTIRALQYNPEATIEYAADTVISMHRVLTSNEIVGV